MTPQQFVDKWQASKLSQCSACPEHLLGLCALLGQPTQQGSQLTHESTRQASRGVYLPRSLELVMKSAPLLARGMSHPSRASAKCHPVPGRRNGAPMVSNSLLNPGNFSLQRNPDNLNMASGLAAPRRYYTDEPTGRAHARPRVPSRHPHDAARPTLPRSNTSRGSFP
jgi:hypothetical protein